MKEVTVKKEYETPVISLIPLHHAPRQIIARGRHKIIRHKRERRDKAILGWAIVSGLQTAVIMVLLVIIYILRAGPI